MQLPKLSEEHKAGLVLAIIILLLSSSSDIVNFVSNQSKLNPFEIPLCRVTNEIKLDVVQTEKDKFVNVPDYTSKIFLDFSKKQYFVDDLVELNVKIDDKGILPLEKPYFYILVFSPSDKLKSMFPCFVQEKEKQFTGGSSSTFPQEFKSKWDKWVSPTNVLVGNQHLSCTDKEAFYFSPNDCILRKSLIEGRKDSNQLLSYTFKVEEPGNWKIYIFLFDEEYKTRTNVQLQYSQSRYESGPASFQNAVVFAFSEFVVSSGSPPVTSGIESGYLILKLVSILIAYIGYYGIGRKEIYPLLKRFWLRFKNEIIRIIIFLTIVTIYTILLFSVIK